MTNLLDIKREFIRIYEEIMTIRGLPTIFGRIIAIFLIESKELTQEEIAKLTEYSISSVSRTLDQMIRVGIVRKTKDMSSKQYIYSMHLNIRDMVIDSLVEGNKATKNILQQINELKNKSISIKYEEKDRKQKKILDDKLQELENSLNQMIEIVEKVVKELKSV